MTTDSGCTGKWNSAKRIGYSYTCNGDCGGNPAVPEQWNFAQRIHYDYPCSGYHGP